MPQAEKTISVLCVDDNRHVAEAVQIKLNGDGGMTWLGWLESADDLVQRVFDACPSVVLLDIDMPGRDPFEALSELSESCPNTRTIMFTGHVSCGLINRAIESGAWGYVSKSDGDRALMEAIRQVAAGNFHLSAEVLATLNGC